MKGTREYMQLVARDAHEQFMGQDQAHTARRSPIKLLKSHLSKADLLKVPAPASRVGQAALRAGAAAARSFPGRHIMLVVQRQIAQAAEQARVVRCGLRETRRQSNPDQKMQLCRIHK